MTRIFEDLIDSPSNSDLVVKFYDFVADIDDNPELRKKFIESALTDSGERNVRYYISKNCPNSYISSIDTFDRNEDFTFPMPTMLGT